MNKLLMLFFLTASLIASSISWSDDPQLLVEENRALDAADTGDFAKAAEILETVIATYDSPPSVIFLRVKMTLATIYQRLDRNTEAIQLLDEIIELKASDLGS
ncbi:MAG: hypothetical protein ACI909_002526 [Planctomycetota bacterium]|jgi:hypothetical protein